MTAEANNERRCCQEIMHLIEHEDGGPLANIVWADKVKRRDPQTVAEVELLFDSPKRRYAVEHTRLENFERQIHQRTLLAELGETLEEYFEGMVPHEVVLTLEIGAVLSLSKSDVPLVREALKTWVLSEYPKLQDGEQTSATLADVPFPVVLQRIHHGHRHRFVLWRVWPTYYEGQPNDLSLLRLERVQEALDRKCPKLARHKAAGRETVLVFELQEWTLGNNFTLSGVIAQALMSRTDRPSRLFLFETQPGFSWLRWELIQEQSTAIGPAPLRLERILTGQT